MNVPVPFRYLVRGSLLLMPLLLAMAGCGGKSQVDCTPLDLSVTPQTATADHAAAAPGDQISFIAFNGLRPGCPPTPGPIRGLRSGNLHQRNSVAGHRDCYRDERVGRDNHRHCYAGVQVERTLWLRSLAADLPCTSFALACRSDGILERRRNIGVFGHHVCRLGHVRFAPEPCAHCLAIGHRRPAFTPHRHSFVGPAVRCGDRNSQIPGNGRPALEFAFDPGLLFWLFLLYRHSRSE
jgi:hypothetical protein